MNILEANILVFDTETTGIDPTTDAIVELAAVDLCRGQIGRSFTLRLNPGMPIPPEASSVHGIRDQDVADAPFFDEVADRVAARLGAADVVLAGYNAVHFDVPMLNMAAINAGHSFRIDPARVLDPFIFLRRRHNHLPSKLGDVCARHGIQLDRAHAADADARATAELLVSFVREGLMPTELDHALKVQAQWREVLVREEQDFGRKLYRDVLGDGEAVLRIGFGKNRGERLTDVDAGLLRWVLSRPDFHPGARAAFQAEVDRRSGRSKKAHPVVGMAQRHADAFDSNRCEHPQREIRCRPDSMGRRRYVMQCVTCGYGGDRWGVGQPEQYSREDAVMRCGGEPPMFDEGLLARTKADWSARSKVQADEMRKAYGSYIASDQWKEKRAAVIERANGRCEKCKKVEAEQVHHMTYERLGDEMLVDLIALCGPCHMAMHDIVHNIPPGIAPADQQMPIT